MGQHTLRCTIINCVITVTKERPCSLERISNLISLYSTSACAVYESDILEMQRHHCHSTNSKCEANAESY